MRIKSIYINGLHNAVNKTYEFGDIVYIFGNNGVGKSTILQAIQLALLGYIPGTAKNSKEALLRHSPIGEIEVCLTLVSDNDNAVTIQRNINKNGNFKIITPESYDINQIIDELELPIFNFNEFVGQTANKLKEYFIKHILPTVDGNLDWNQILTDSISGCNFEDRGAILKYGLSLVEGIDGELLDQVVSANKKFKDEQSFNKAESQRLQNTIDSLIYYDDYIGPMDINQLNSDLLSLGAIRDQLIRYNSAIETTKSTTDEIDKLNSEINYLGGKGGYELRTRELSQYKSQYQELSENINLMQNRLTTLKAQDSAAESIIQSKGVCPYTKESCKSMTTKIEDLRNDSVGVRAAIVELNSSLEIANSHLNALNLNIRKCESAISDFNMKWNRMESLKKVISDLPEKPNTDKTIFEIDAEIEVLSQSKSKLEANIRYNETIENLTKLKYSTELQSEALTKWVKTTDTNGLQTTLMVAPFENLAETMTQYIQQMYGRTDITAHFVISSKSNSFSFGLIRDDVYIPYDLLSSGEKCLYNLALMICIVNNNKSPLKVLLCDDMFDHLDQNAIESTFATLKEIDDIQFIFAGVKYCTNAKDVMITPD